MLRDILDFDNLVVPDEAKTGSAGEQPARNNPANVNSWRLVPTGLLIYNIHIFMPQKTHIFFAFCPFLVGAVHYTLHSQLIKQCLMVHSGSPTFSSWELGVGSWE